MNRTTPRSTARLSPFARRVAVATAILAPVGLLAAAGSAGAAGSTTPTSSVPEGTTSLTDVTGLLTINVPAEWTATNLNPTDRGPSIWATTDMEQFENGVTVPGVAFDVAVTQETETEARLTEFMAQYGIDNGDCEAGEPRPLTTHEGTGHGALEGTANTYVCGGSNVMGFVGVAADGSGVEVFIQLPDGEDTAIVDGILDTFTYGDLSTFPGTAPGGSGVPGSSSPTPTVPGATVPAPAPGASVPVPAPPATAVPSVPTVPVPGAAVPAPGATVPGATVPVPAPGSTVPGATAPVPAPGASVPTTAPGGSVAPGALAGQVPVTDETGRLTIQVPATWTDTNLVPMLDQPSIWAAPDLDQFDADPTTSGVQFDVTTPILPAGDSAVMAQFESAGIDVAQCTETVPMSPYTSIETGLGVFTGFQAEFDCAGTRARAVIADSADGALQLNVFIRLAAGEDPAVADNMLTTFTLS